MLSIQEMLSKTEKQRQEIESFMDTMKYYDPAEVSLTTGLKRSIQREINETIRNISLKEALLKSGDSDVAGAAYLVPAIVSQKLYSGLYSQDIVPLVCADVITNPASDAVRVNVGTTLQAKQVSAYGGGHETVEVTPVTLTLEKYNVPSVITRELIEDQEYGVVEWHIKEAGKALANIAKDKCLAVAKRTLDTTGFGDKTAEAASADSTTPSEIAACVCEVAAGAELDVYKPDTMIISSEAWWDAAVTTAGHPEVTPPQVRGFDAWYGGLDTLICNSLELGVVASNRLTDAVTIILQRDVALIAARKSWGRIENYSKPVDDLAGAVVSGRQAVGEMVDAAIGVLTEA